MATRFQDALLIQQGACNPSGVTHALLNACKECIEEGTSQRTDPAVRLIVHQLAHLCNIDQINDSLLEYAYLTDYCKTQLRTENNDQASD